MLKNIHFSVKALPCLKNRFTDPLIHNIWQIFLLAVGALLSQSAYAQKKPIDLTTTGIQVGKSVPDITVNNLYNYYEGGKEKTSMTLSSQKGKLLIIDFWATWCSPCVGMMPKMDSLQKAFKGKLQFLSVTNEPDAKVRAFLKKFNSSHSSGIPVATEDVTLAKLFPHRLIPHYIWIDAEGKVVAITDHKEITVKNIGDAINKILPAGMKQKHDMKVAYDRKAPLFIQGNGGEIDKFKYHRIFTGHQQGLPNFSWINAETNKATVTNLPLAGMFAAAYSSKISLGLHRQVHLMKDPRVVRYDKSAGDGKEWIRNNFYCYELVLPGASEAELRHEMINDLNRLFPAIRVDTVTMETMCTVLVSTGDNSMLRSKGGERAIGQNMLGMQIQNMGIVALTSRLDKIYLQGNPYPVDNDSHINFNIDLKLDADLGSIESLNNALAKYNLKFIDKPFKTMMIVFKDAVSENNRGALK